MILFTGAAPCRGIDVVRYTCWCRMMMWTTSVSLTGAGNGVGNIPWMVASPKAPLKSWIKWPEEKTRAPSCRNQHETQILQKTVLKSKKQRIKKFMKTSGNTSVSAERRGNTMQNHVVINEKGGKTQEFWTSGACPNAKKGDFTGAISHPPGWFYMV